MKEIHIPKNIRGLIFDCDGTLVDSMPLHMEAWKAAFKEYNSYYNENFLFSLKGMKEIEIIDLYNKKFNTNLVPWQMVSAKHKYFIENINSVKRIEQIVQIAEHYFEKLPLAVVSGSVSKIVTLELKTIGIINLFKIVLTADDPYEPKPSPAIFLAAASQLNLEPESCLVFEDGDAGLDAASRAGMETIDIRKYI
ncbi:MAG: HAD-IA family hydrolase [Ignavibacteriaceae bacterium]